MCHANGIPIVWVTQILNINWFQKEANGNDEVTHLRILFLFAN